MKWPGAAGRRHRFAPLGLGLGILGSVAVLCGTRWWLGTNDWAGLGQWVGGLGALVAAGTALYIANRDLRRELAREAERVRVHAYYVEAKILFPQQSMQVPRVAVVNAGTEPVLNVRLMMVHRANPSSSPVEIDGESECPVLLPDEPWTNSLTVFPEEGDTVEIAYDDLAGTRWRRNGKQAPLPSAN
ncbi:hypothetical protein ACFWY9_25600 [Amycolatopsis sp. NPDC059027]|uniref:hypothetical protein n=1 Tax=Amycolatopsis sp. NPDC059027 TaxID=3346709 RepID=UPI00366F87A5